MDNYRISEAIKELKQSKSRDSCGISKEIIKNIQKSIIPSLTRLAKLSFKKQKVPECQKMVHIIGIPKGSGSDKPSGIRPINLTSNLSKIWERVIKQQVFPHLEDKRYFKHTGE